MFKKFAIAASIAASLASFATGATAADNATQPYIGVDGGATKFDGFSGRHGSFGGFVGLQFTPNIAVEGAYRRLGAMTVAGVDVSTDQAALSLIGSIPMGNAFSAFGRLGYNRLSADASLHGASASGSTSGGLYGLGLAYDASSNVAVRLEFQKPSSDSSNLSLAVAFKF